MSLTRQEVQTKLADSAERLDKLSSDFLYLAEQSSIESLKNIKKLRKRAEEGRMSFLEASEAAAGMATALQDNLDAIEAGESVFDLAAHQNECDSMIEALMSMRGQARRTVQALGKHLSKLQSELEPEAVEAKG